MIELDTMKRHVEEFLYITEPARTASERDRDYKDNKQWTQEQLDKLAERQQAPVIDNRIKPKVEGLKGLLIQRRSDPKAYARTRAHEQSSEAITDALRYVDDNCGMDDLELDVFDNVIVEGYGATIVDIEVRANGDIEPMPTLIPWDRFYYDPHSRRIDFKDATYMGIIMWMDADIAKSMFKDRKAKDAIDASVVAGDLYETFEDRPRWREINGDRKRIRLAHEFYLLDGKWMECLFGGGGFLVEPMESTYLDEDGIPCNPIEAVGAYIDRDNNRFGEVRYWVDTQNEINHRRSKFLHMMSSRQTFGKHGVQDVPALKREMQLANGHLEFVGGEFGKDFGIVPTMDMAEAQFTLLQESKQSMDSVSFNAQLSGERQGNLSGVAVESLQMAGMLEVNGLFSAMLGWKRRVYKQVWYRIKQHWKQEKWVRVTDDYGKLRWVGLNAQVTREQLMQEFIADKSQPEQDRKQAAQVLQMMQQQQHPGLQEVIETKNEIPELDMDIILAQSTNSVNIQQEQFRLLVELASANPGQVPFKSILKISELRDKDDVIKDIEEREQAQMQAQQQMMQLETADKTVSIQGKQITNQLNSVKIEEAGGKALNLNMDAIGKQIANQQLLANPDPNPQTSV